MALITGFEPELAEFDGVDRVCLREELGAVQQREALDATSAHPCCALIVALRASRTERDGLRSTLTERLPMCLSVVANLATDLSETASQSSSGKVDKVNLLRLSEMLQLHERNFSPFAAPTYQNGDEFCPKELVDACFSPALALLSPYRT